MKNESPHITPLISKYICRTLTVEEEMDLQTWLREDEEHQELFDYLVENDNRTLQDLVFFQSLDIQASWKRLLKRKKGPAAQRWVFGRTRYAMVVGIVVSVAGWLFFNHWAAGRNANPVPIVYQQGGVPPGGSKALLLLSDNQWVELSSAPATFTERDGTAIANESGILRYDQRSYHKDASLLHNTLLVPKTGMYRLTLSDGTRVWVNALSELRFPVQFGKHERKVFLKGEAYFEVSRDALRPFFVEVDGSVIEVLGTRFNINAYKQITTTLVHGAVKITLGNRSEILKPGQEAYITDTISVREAMVEKATAWKDGDFYFQRDSIQEIMDQLSRWYGVSVDYQGAVSTQTGYNGRIRRDEDLSEVLSMLAFATGADITMSDDRKVTVSYHRKQDYHP